MTDQIAVTGNLTSAPERREVSGGVTMVTFGLASTERRLVEGVWVDGHTNYYNVSVFRRLADHALQSLEKGQRVIIQGKLKLRQWEANGRTGTSADLEAASLGPDLKFGVASFVKDGRPHAAPDGSHGDGEPECAPDGAVDLQTGEIGAGSDAGPAEGGARRGGARRCRGVGNPDARGRRSVLRRSGRHVAGAVGSARTPRLDGCVDPNPPPSGHRLRRR